jgi:microcystin-dependent protein
MEGTIGEIRLFGGSFIPQGWTLCNGHDMPVNQWAALYSVLGTNHGGDGINTFKLPKIDSLTQWGPHYIICIQGIYPARD